MCADRGGILQRVLDLCLPEENISTTDSPQHPLKGGNPLPVDHPGHKSVSTKHRADEAFTMTNIIIQ